MATVHSLAVAARKQQDQQQPRLGPRPLGLHLMTALCAWLSLPIMLPSLNGALSGLNPGQAAKWQKIKSALSANPEKFSQALSREALARAQRVMQGIRAYQQHPVRRDVPEVPVIWQRGSACLRDYNPRHADAPVILVIPSLINRYDILDLDLAPSFLRSLAAQGLRPLVVDWGRPGSAESAFGLGDYIAQRLIPALDFIKAPVHLLGYCMGGLLALGLATHRPDKIRTLTLMATPWDFHQPDPAIGAQFLALAAQMENTLVALGEMPVDIIQGLFAALQPLQAMAKFADFAATDPLSVEARHFVLVEDWLNDGIPLTAEVARECLVDWYGNNSTAQNRWRVGNKLIDPRKLAMPSYVVVPGNDRIVPPESALPLAKLLPHASLHEPMTGHIGMLASSRASHQVWAPMFHWLAEHG